MGSDDLFKSVEKKAVNFFNPGARIFVPDGKPAGEALRRITHLGIGAHQDDLEFMALHGILACYDSATNFFAGSTCTSGAGSARTGPYAHFTDEEMRAIRRKEQDAAAVVGRYGAMIHLDYESAALKGATAGSLKEDLKAILAVAHPRFVYTHNPADKHETHVAVFVAVLQALRESPRDRLPEAVYGCEVWRSLDWMPDAEKVIHDVSAHENLSAALTEVFDSQISGGKRYDLAILGRRRANATFLDSHSIDKVAMASLAMDLTPLIADPSRDIVEYVAGFVKKFETDVRAKLTKHLGGTK